MVTTYELTKKFAEVTRHAHKIQTNSVGKSTASQTLKEEGTVLLSEKKIIKVQGDYVITEDNTKARLFSPIPCFYWKCTATPNSNGVSTLRNKITGLFIEDGSNTYCLGISGYSDEFELRFQIGTDELRMNNNYLNIKTSLFTLNGLEVKNE